MGPGGSAKSNTPSVAQTKARGQSSAGEKKGPKLVDAPENVGPIYDSDGEEIEDDTPDEIEFRAGRLTAIRLNNGSTIESLREGDRLTFPSKGTFCRIHYDARVVNTAGVIGPSFDSSERRGIPFDFQIGAGYVLHAVENALRFCSRGQEIRLSLPPQIAYGVVGMPPTVPPNSIIEYTISLISMQD